VDSWSFGETRHYMSIIDPASGKPRGAMDNVAFGTHDGTSGNVDALCHDAVQGNGPIPGGTATPFTALATF
jgi:hypothetical protein